MKSILRSLCFAPGLFAFSIFSVCAQTSTPYDWKNVVMNGGGFVSGVVYSKAEPNLIYARTDVGGAYRWVSGTQSWLPVTDQLSADEGNYTGVLSIAPDPSDANRVYLATGLYTPWWAGTAAILASTNKGDSWTAYDLPIKLGGNEDGRSAGERLQVDPNAGNILYLGTSKDGLWKSIDYGATWNKVSSFPVAATTGAGISFVLFDKASGTPGSATPAIYVAVLQTGNNFYKSPDGGVTWQPITLPDASMMPMQAALASNGMMYIAASNGPGPNGVSAGAVYKFNTQTSAFSTINPPAGQGGYGGISVDAQNPDVVLVSTIDRWYPRDEIFRTTNGGASWKGILTTGTLDNSSAPYSASSTPHWTGDVDIDPFNSSNAWFITGYGLFNSTNVTASEQNNPVTWSFKNKGLEETVVLSMISPPTGAPLLSAVGDIDGFKHDSLDVSPAAGRLTPLYGTNTSIAFAEAMPTFMARTHYNSTGHYGAYSTNGGSSWTAFLNHPSGTSGGGKIAASANGATLVWTPDNAGAFYSTNNGSSWTASSGSPVGFAPVADRVNSSKFYIYNAGSGQLFVSNNAGVSFTLAATGLPTVPDYLYYLTDMKAVFGAEGDVWLCNPNGLYRSTNSGTSFTKLANVEARKIAFGKAAPGQSYPAVYIAGKVNNVYGFYRSADAGATWIRINDDSHQFGGINVLEADRNVFGRLYVGTGGRGILYGIPSVSLPVTMSPLKGQFVRMNNADYSRLTWRTETEMNNKGFEVERSLNSVEWSRVGAVRSKAINGNSNQQLNYEYDDNSTAFSGILYYRLKQADADGRSFYSNVVGINKNGVDKGLIVGVNPNPVIGGRMNVIINSSTNQQVQIRVINMSGESVYTGKRLNVMTGENRIIIDGWRIAKGNYIVEMVNERGEVIGSVKVIK